MRAALDTNVLVYASGFGFGVSDAVRGPRARRLIADLNGSGEGVVIAAQTLLELFEVLTRKAGWPSEMAAAEVDRVAGEVEIVPTDVSLLTHAQSVAVQHGLRIFDAVILAAADSAGCETLYSEDMQHGFAWRRVRIVNPFMD